MRNKLLFIIIACAILISCSKKEDELASEIQNDVKFSISANAGSNSSGRSVASIEDVTKAIFSVTSIATDEEVYVLEEIAIYKLPGGQIISSTFPLLVGDYKLTFFALTDDDGNIKYVTPLEGSEMSAFVQQPLHINFNIAANEITHLNLEVVSVESGDSGYGQFGDPIEIIETINPSIMIFEKNEVQELIPTNASATINALTLQEQINWTKAFDIPSTASTIQLKSSNLIKKYAFEITKPGYEVLDTLISLEEILAKPSLVFVLEKENSYEAKLVTISGERWCCPIGDDYVDEYVLEYKGQKVEKISYQQFKPIDQTSFKLNYMDEKVTSLKYDRTSVKYYDSLVNKTYTINYDYNDQNQVVVVENIFNSFKPGTIPEDWYNFLYNLQYSNDKLEKVNVRLPHQSSSRYDYNYFYNSDEIGGYEVDAGTVASYKVSYTYSNIPNIFPGLFWAHFIDLMKPIRFNSLPQNPHLWTNITPEYMISQYKTEAFDENGIKYIEETYDFIYGTLNSEGLPTSMEVIKNKGKAKETLMFKNSELNYN